MTPAEQPVRCDICNGTGRTDTLVCPGAPLVRLACWACDGAGEITAAKHGELAHAEALRRDRIARGMSQRDEAARLGITPQELNRREYP